MLIYKITNLVNGKIYIGLTVTTIKKRWQRHIDAAKRKKYYICYAINKYKPENFKIEQIDKAFSIKEMESKEMYWIAKYQSYKNHIGYNSTLGGESNIPNDSCIIKRLQNMKNNKSYDSSTSKYIGVAFNCLRNSWIFSFKWKDKVYSKCYFNTEVDAAIARDIQVIKCIGIENARNILNFPKNEAKYLSKEITVPNRPLKRNSKMSKFNFVQWEKKLKKWVVSINYEKKTKRFKMGMFYHEEEAAIVADFFNLKTLNNHKKLNFPDRIDEYNDPNFILPLTISNKKRLNIPIPD